MQVSNPPVPAPEKLLIRGGTVFDGSGAPGIRADVAIEGSRIVAIGPRAAYTSARIIDADGLAVAPGFIDMHSHADFTLPAFPGALNSLAQGVTSEVIGNCGYSPAPVSADPRRAADQVAACHGLGPDLDWSWRSFDEYLGALDRARPAVNCIPLVGHGMLRLAVVGSDDRPASEAELTSMQALAGDALAAGAWGISTGLVYPPGSYAPTDEIVRIGEALRVVDGIYASHIRDETDGLTDALAEAVSIGRQLGVRVQVSHLKAAGRSNHGHAPEALAVLGEARAAGGRVTQDAYPYLAGSTLLTQLLPPWVHDGGPDELVRRLESPVVRTRIVAEVRDGLPGWPNYYQSAGGPASIQIAAVSTPSLRWLEGLSLSEAAARTNGDPLTVAFDTLVADRGATTMIMTLMEEADVDAILDDPATAVGSDQLGVTSPSARVHPRAYGTFVRILGRHVRERRRFDLATAVHRMTGLPASILGLVDRGRIAPGQIADLVVFDPATVADGSTYTDPTAPPQGVEAVLLCGRFAIERGRPVAIGLGEVVRRTVSGPRLTPRSG